MAGVGEVKEREEEKILKWEYMSAMRVHNMRVHESTWESTWEYINQTIKYQLKSHY